MNNQTTASETPEEYKGLHKVLIAVAAFLFAYLVVEGAFIVPFLFIRYGMH